MGVGQAECAGVGGDIGRIVAVEFKDGNLLAGARKARRVQPVNGFDVAGTESASRPRTPKSRGPGPADERPEVRMQDSGDVGKPQNGAQMGSEGRGD